MGILQHLLRQGSFWTINKHICRTLKSNNATILLQDLIDKYYYHELRGELVEKDGVLYFYYKSEDIEENCCLSYREQKTCIELLTSFGMIQTKRIGVPSIVHFSIVEEAIIGLFDLEKDGVHNSQKRNCTIDKSAIVQLTKAQLSINKNKDIRIKKDKTPPPPSPPQEEESKTLLSLLQSFSKKTSAGTFVSEAEALHALKVTEEPNAYWHSVASTLYEEGAFLRRDNHQKLLIIMLEQTHKSLPEVTRLWEAHRNKGKKAPKPSSAAKNGSAMGGNDQEPLKPFKSPVNEQKSMEEWIDAKEFDSLCCESEDILRKLNLYKYACTDIDFLSLYVKMVDYYSDKTFKSKRSIIVHALTFLSSLDKCKQYLKIEYCTFTELFPSFEAYGKMFKNTNLSNYSYAKAKIGTERLEKPVLIDRCKALLTSIKINTEEQKEQKPSINRKRDL